MGNALWTWAGKRGLTPALATLAVLAVLARNSSALTIEGIHVYQRVLSPIADRVGARCRFVPSCSRYAETVIARDGLIVGGWKTLRRVARCGPWTPMGTRDDP